MLAGKSLSPPLGRGRGFLASYAHGQPATHYPAPFWLGPLYSALTIFSTRLRLELAGGGWGPDELPPQPGSFLILPPELPGFLLATVPE